jgi:predicted ATP-grasp superfamily ATP-dependent carboligase
MVLPDHATVLRCFDKLETLRIAESLGVKAPRTLVIDDPAQARELAPALPYPVVLKPRTSFTLSLGGQVCSTGRPQYGRNRGEFVATYEKLRGRVPSVLVQEYIEGRGAGYFALMCHGQVRAEFAHLRIRDARPTGSGSSVRVSAAMEPQVRAAGRGILEALNWHGVAMVEFRVTPAGTPVFMEVNGRFWHSLALAVLAGVDFPALMAQLALDGDVNPVVGYRVGVRCRWLLGDFRHLVEVMRGAPPGFPGKFPGRLRTLVSFVVPSPGMLHDNFRLSDPLPELGDWLDFLLRRIPAAARR